MSEYNRGARPHAEKVHQEKVQQEKLKKVKAHLNFEGCSGRNSNFQEMSQHSKSRTPNVRGEYRRGRRSGSSRSMFESLEHASVFSRIRCDSEDNEGGHCKSRSKKQKSSIEDGDLSQPWVWFDDLPLESIDSYDDLKKAFLANYLQQKKCIKDLVEIHHIKQREGESTEDFVQRGRWQLPTSHGRRHFQHGSNGKLEENKILTEGKISEISRDRS
uniref:Reverse transcriptase domain-containing protein n=1 Tax=Tanacetum cinerariifolium TaxID=118510 RepID=A0A699HQC4_TANCI|nr:reverse transcriptase domain-containing protein [Tanacetum cinerariifolium]